MLQNGVFQSFLRFAAIAGYSWPLFFDILAATRFMTLVQLGPEPPVVKETKVSINLFSAFKTRS